MPFTRLPNRKADAYSVTQSQCPLPIRNRTYLGIRCDRAQRRLSAYLYKDGEYQHTLGPVVDHALQSWSVLGIPSWTRAHVAGDVVVFKVWLPPTSQRLARDGIATWTPATATVNVLDTGFRVIGGPIVVGASIYFQVPDNGIGKLQLYKVPLNSRGELNEPDARLGDPFEDPDLNLAVPTILCHTGGETFQVPGFWFGDGPLVRVPWFKDGKWTLGEERALVSGSGDTGPVGNGFAVGTHSLRVTYRPGYFPELGLLPRGTATPNTPEIGLFPAVDPPIVGVGDLSVSPNGQEAVIFPIWLDGETGDDQDNRLFRLPTSGPYQLPAGCPLPRIQVEPGPEGYPEVLLARD